MGQNSSVVVGTTKDAPVKGNIIVDASDSCVSGIKLRSTGIIPISELIKQEKCSKNIQKIEKNYYNRRKTLIKPKENLKSKKVKAEFIDTSFDDVPAKRQWVRVNSVSKNPFESDAVKIGLKKPSKTIINDNQDGIQNGFRDCNQTRSSERNQENSRHGKRENIRGNSQGANRENIKVDVREVARPSTRNENRKNVRIGTQEFSNKDILQKSIGITEKKKIVADQAKKSNLKNNAIDHKFKESSTQTMTRNKEILYENLNQLHKRNEIDEKKRSKNYCQDEKGLREILKKAENKIKQQKKKNTLRDLEESTHQIQTHDISHHKRKSKKPGKKLIIETNMLYSISPEKHTQWQMSSNDKLEKCAGRNYINRKLTGEYYSGEEKCAPCDNDIKSFNSSDKVQFSMSLLPSASTLEQAIKEHRKYISAKEALESWKNHHTWKQHKKRFQKSRNKCYQDHFDVPTETVFIRPKHLARNRSNRYIHENMIVPSEKHLYKDFIFKMEHCLQKHSRLCELNAKRNGEAKYTWVQDKYRRWHKITFDDYKN